MVQQHQMPESDMRNCARQCSECHDICIETIQHCLQAGGAHAQHEHLTLMFDCGQICATSRDFLLRSSPRHVHTCRACAEVCDACADDCERLGDDMMRRCAEACRVCAESCRHMSALAA